MTEKNKETDKTEPTEDFQSLIRAHQIKNKSTITDAMRAVAKSHPEAHQAYLQAGGGPIDKIEADEDKSFEALVDEYMDRNSCGKVQAMQAVVRLHPRAHQAFVDAVNQ